MGRVVGIDYGLARIGLAISDEKKIIASSLGTLPSKKVTRETIASLLKALLPYTIETIVVGLPLHMNGSKGFLADEVLYFVSLLKENTSIPIVTLDERLSTLQAEKFLRHTSLSRKKRSHLIDGISATIILQNYLDLKETQREGALSS